MKALTLWQPWSYAIARLGKRIENRTWMPPVSAIGTRIAIHAGKRLDQEAVGALGERFQMPASFTHGAVESVGTLLGWTGSISEDHPQLYWFDGPYCWVFGDVVALPSPIACRGAQGLWTLSEGVESAVRGQLQ